MCNVHNKAPTHVMLLDDYIRYLLKHTKAPTHVMLLDDYIRYLLKHTTMYRGYLLSGKEGIVLNLHA